MFTYKKMLALAFFVVLLTNSSWAQARPKINIVIADFVPEKRAHGRYSKALANNLLEELGNRRGLNLVERRRMRALLKERELSALGIVMPTIRAKFSSATHVLIGSYQVSRALCYERCYHNNCYHDVLALRLRLVEVNSGKILHVASIRSNQHELDAAIETLADRIENGVVALQVPIGYRTPEFIVNQKSTKWVSFYLTDLKISVADIKRGRRAHITIAGENGRTLRRQRNVRVRERVFFRYKNMHLCLQVLDYQNNIKNDFAYVQIQRVE